MSRAVGIHVFAGGFTMGVKAAGTEVVCQLETHGFGLDTAKQVAGVQTINDPAKDWPAIEAEWCFGNPRCTGFSCVTGGYHEDAHGPWSAPTVDIHELCEYAAGRYDVIVWESVQQAISTGRPLLDYLRDEIFAPKHYRIAHLKLNAASFGNPQQRKRYFFVAYRDDRVFNIEPPPIEAYYPVTYDAIWDLRDEQAVEVPMGEVCERNHYPRLTDDEKAVLPLLPNGWDLNSLAPYVFDRLPVDMQIRWETRQSNMPFSMHSVNRTNWLRPFPTITSSCHRKIHPWHNRPLTVHEIARCMGWGDSIPVGKMPFAQIAKGIVPSVGTWLARQVDLYLNDAWGSDDYESRYDQKTGSWVGDDTTGQLEKTFDLTRYVGQLFDLERYDESVRVPRHRLNVDCRTGRLIHPWEEVEQSFRRHAGDARLRCKVDIAQQIAAAESGARA